MAKENKNPNLNELLKSHFGNNVISELEHHYASGSKGFIDVEKIKDNRYFEGIPLSEQIIQGAAFELNNQNISPLIVVREYDGVYEIVSGRKYLLAAKKEKIGKIQTLVTKMDNVSMVVTLIRNLSQQKEKNVVEIAYLLNALISEYHFTPKQISHLTRLSISQISNLNRIMKLPRYIMKKVSIGLISFGHVKVISILPEDEMKKIADRIIDEDLSVRETEALINDSASTIGTILNRSGVVKIRQTKKTITIEFGDEEDKIKYLNSIKNN